MSQELKPCPFCGGNPAFQPHGKNGLVLRCTVCFVKFERRVLRFSLDWLKEKMTDHWNNRINKSMNSEGEL